MVNNTVLQGLNTVKRNTSIYATLNDEQDKPLFTFLYNPEEKTFSKTAKYDEGDTALSQVQTQFYKYTTGATLNLPNLILESYASSKSCQTLLDQLQGLMVADLTNKTKVKYAPPTVYFKWGSYSFGPAVITSLSWTETSWLDGFVSSARVNLQLLEIPVSQLSPNSKKAKKPTNTDKQQAAVTNAATLTDRQQQDALVTAQAWLKQNAKSMSPYLQAIISNGNYNLGIDATGKVSLTTPGVNGTPTILGTIGTYADNKLDWSSQTLYPFGTVTVPTTANNVTPQTVGQTTTQSTTTQLPPAVTVPTTTTTTGTFSTTTTPGQNPTTLGS